MSGSADMARRAVVTVALLGGLLGPRGATAAPVTFETIPSLERGRVVAEAKGLFLDAPDGPPPERAHETEFELRGSVLWGATRHMTLGLMVPLVWRRSEVSSPLGARVTRQVAGVGDITVIAAFRPFPAAGPREPFSVSPVVGLRLPTGPDDIGDKYGRFPQRFQLGAGAWSPFVGANLTWCVGRIRADLGTTFVLRARANDFDAGDEIRVEGSAAVRLLPWGPHSAPDALHLHAGLETRALIQGRDAGPLAAAESGGVDWTAGPTLRLGSPCHQVVLGLELPIVQAVGRHAAVRALIGYRASS